MPDYFNGRLRIVADRRERPARGRGGSRHRSERRLHPHAERARDASRRATSSSSASASSTTRPAAPVRFGWRRSRARAVARRRRRASTCRSRTRRKASASSASRPNAALGVRAADVHRPARGRGSAHVEESVGVRPAAAFRTQLTLGRVDGAGATAPLTRDLYSAAAKGRRGGFRRAAGLGPGTCRRISMHYEYTLHRAAASAGDVAALILTSRPEFGTSSNAAATQPLDATFCDACAAARTKRAASGLWAATPETAEFADGVRARTSWSRRRIAASRFRRTCWPASTTGSTRFAVNAGEHACRRPDARLRGVPAGAPGHQADGGDLKRRAGADEPLRRQAWPTDLAAAYLASTYRLMQRTRMRIASSRSVPWSAAEGRDLGDDDIYYDAVVHDAQLLYLLARHFPASARRDAAGRARGDGAAVSGNQAQLAVGGLHAARARRVSPKRAASDHARHQRDRQGRPVARADAAGRRDAARSPSRRPRPRCSSPERGPLPAYYVLNESGFDRNPPTTEMQQGVEIVREFVDEKGNVADARDGGQEFFVRLRVRAHDARSAAADRRRRSAAGRRRAGAGAAGAGRLAARLEGSGDAATGRRSAALPIGVPGKSDWTPSHVDVRDDRLVLYGDADAGTSGRSCIACAPTTRAPSRCRRRLPRACTTARSSALEPRQPRWRS